MLEIWNLFNYMTLDNPDPLGLYPYQREIFDAVAVVEMAVGDQCAGG